MTSETDITATLKGLLLAALLCFAMVYSQIVHAAVPPSTDDPATISVTSVVGDEGAADAHQHGSQTDEDGEHDHSSGKPDSNCSTHCPSVFGMNGAGVESIRLSSPAELVAVEPRLDGMSVPADQRPPRS